MSATPNISISLDGFVAGPNPSDENPLGEGGERLHDWVVSLAAWRQSHGHQGGEINESARIVEESRENVGAGVMGRNMFGPVGGGPWSDEEWTGWCGDDPPYHYPVFIPKMELYTFRPAVYAALVAAGLLHSPPSARKAQQPGLVSRGLDAGRRARG